MAPKQRMNVANTQFSKNVNNRGNVAKSLVSSSVLLLVTQLLQSPRKTNIQPLRGSLVFSCLWFAGQVSACDSSYSHVSEL
ncbi:hypothetical protein Y032_0024g971 [Ancylostoma ceylanicum]|uniref:Uncharacterized protein n=1 Tax=Ancylostoma ceylanicum TaxID=53326 RepID=A0A016UX95_9BILA|nr:hypothetical protein Y032_0024g971 [Ancylostoma ceylanicum]